MTSTLRGWGLGGKAKLRCYRIGRRGWRVRECSGRPIFLFLIKGNWIWAMTRHHAEPNNRLLARNLPFDLDVRQWSHPLMIPFHCLWVKLNKRTRGQFEYGVTWFCTDFVRSHARCDCCSIICLHFQVVKIKQVDCKMSTENKNNYK